MPAAANLVYQTTTTTGTGPFALASVTGWRTFQAEFGLSGAADQFYVFIRHTTAAEWVWGTGHLDGSGNLVIDTITNGSAGAGVAVSFSAGDKDVICDVPAETQNTTHNTTVSTSDPSGGADGDVWYKVVV